MKVPRRTRNGRTPKSLLRRPRKKHTSSVRPKLSENVSEVPRRMYLISTMAGPNNQENLVVVVEAVVDVVVVKVVERVGVNIEAVAEAVAITMANTDHVEETEAHTVAVEAELMPLPSPSLTTQLSLPLAESNRFFRTTTVPLARTLAATQLQTTGQIDQKIPFAKSYTSQAKSTKCFVQNERLKLKQSWTMVGRSHSISWIAGSLSI